MIIIHAAQLDGSLTLWGEDSDPPRPSERLSEAHHPRCVSAFRLSEAVGIPHEGAAGDEAGGVIWLPSRGNNPMPSEALAGPALKSRAKPRIKPWRVPILRLSSGQAIELLHRCQDRRVLAPGTVLSPDVTYWRYVMLFAAALTVRQQFLPNVAQNGGKPKPCGRRSTSAATPAAWLSWPKRCRPRLGP